MVTNGDGHWVSSSRALTLLGFCAALIPTGCGGSTDDFTASGGRPGTLGIGGNSDSATTAEHSLASGGSAHSGTGGSVPLTTQAGSTITMAGASATGGASTSAAGNTSISSSSSGGSVTTGGIAGTGGNPATGGTRSELQATGGAFVTGGSTALLSIAAGGTTGNGSSASGGTTDIGSSMATGGAKGTGGISAVGGTSAERSIGSGGFAATGGSQASGGSAATDTCGTNAALSIVGDYTALDSSEVWIRDSKRAASLATIPTGVAKANKLPSLFRIERTCSLQQTLVVLNETGSYIRVDWARSGSTLYLCWAPEAKTSIDAALLASPQGSTTTLDGCYGSPWQSLELKGGQP